MSALAQKDSNAQISASKSQQSFDESKMSTSDGQKDLLSRNSASNSTSDTYISPSDAIMSPASKKLATFKQKQINRQNDTARRSLFARTLSSNSEKSNEKSLEDWK